MEFFRSIWFFSAAFASIVLSCVAAPTAGLEMPLAYLQKYSQSIGRTQQAVVVRKSQGASSATVSLYEDKGSGQWERTLGPMPATLGRKGIAAYDTKREGDGKTPSGVFPLSLVFGYAATMDTRMPYRQARQNDYWVDDPNHPAYNRWVSGTTDAASYEHMKRDDPLYSFGIVIDYNVNPVVKGKGSAIFYHVWKCPECPTAGCIALDDKNIKTLIRLLDPDKRPVAVIMDEE